MSARFTFIHVIYVLLYPVISLGVINIVNCRHSTWGVSTGCIVMVLFSIWLV